MATLNFALLGQYKLGRDTWVRIETAGPLTQAALEKLRAYLDLCEPDPAPEKEPAARARETEEGGR